MLLTNLTPDTAYSVQVQAEINSMKSNSEQAIERTLEEIIHLQVHCTNLRSKAHEFKCYVFSTCFFQAHCIQ